MKTRRATCHTTVPRPLNGALPATHHDPCPGRACSACGVWVRSGERDGRRAVEVVAVAGGVVVHGCFLVVGEVAQQSDVEGDAVGFDGAFHVADDLGVDDRHAGRRFTATEFEPGDVDQIAAVLVTPVVLVKDLEQVSPRRQRVLIGCIVRVPEPRPVELERGDLVGDVGETRAHVAQRHRGPVGDVAFGGRAVPGEVAEHQLGAGRLDVESAGTGYAFLQQGVGVLAVARASRGRLMSSNQPMSSVSTNLSLTRWPSVPRALF